MKIRILQINKLYYPVVGGIERVVTQLTEGMKDITDTKVLVCQKKGRTLIENINGVEVCRAGSFGTYFSMPLSMLFFIKYWSMSRDRDIINIHMPFPLADIAVSLLGFKGKVVLWWHSDVIRQKKLLMLYKPFMKKLLKRADAIIVATEGHINGSGYLNTYKEKCVVIPYGVDYRFLREKSLNVQQNKHVTILFVGRLVYYKGCDVLLKAFSKVTGARLRIVGNGPLANELKKMAVELNISDKVEFVYESSDDELNNEFLNCDFFVLPSIEKTEAFGLVQIEAMACQKPVINTNLQNGVPYVSLNDITGITVPPRDIQALAQAMQKLIDNPELRKQYGQEAHKRVLEEFTLEKMNERVFNLYRRLMNLK